MLMFSISLLSLTIRYSYIPATFLKGPVPTWIAHLHKLLVYNVRVFPLLHSTVFSAPSHSLCRSSDHQKTLFRAWSWLLWIRVCRRSLAWKSSPLHKLTKGFNLLLILAVLFSGAVPFLHNGKWCRQQRRKLLFECRLSSIYRFGVSSMSAILTWI